MFGEKQARIDELTSRLRGLEKTNQGLLGSVVKLVNQNRDYEARVETLDYALSESKGMNQALEDENRDLVRQLELLRALLSQVRVNTTLPARKK